MEGISKYFFPPAISIREKTITQDQGRETERLLSIHSYILPAFALLFLLFVCNAVFEDILWEKESGTLLRMTISPLKLNEFIWSKIIISTVIGMICTLVLVLFGKLLFSIYWGIQAFLKNMLGDPLLEIVPILVVMVIAGLVLASSSAYFLNKHLKKGITG